MNISARGLSRGLSAAASVGGDLFESMLFHCVLFIRRFAGLLVPIFDRVESSFQASWNTSYKLFSRRAKGLLELFEQLSALLIRLMSKSLYRSIIGFVFLSAIAVWRIRLIDFGSVSANDRVLYLTVALFLVLSSVYLFLVSQLEPVRAILSAWSSLPRFVLEAPLAYAVAVCSVGLGGLSSYFSSSILQELGKAALPVILSLSVVSYMLIPFIIELITHELRKKTQRGARRLSHPVQRRLLSLFFSLCVAFVIISLRILQTYPFPLYRSFPLVRQSLPLMQYLFLASTAFVLPSLAIMQTKALRRAFLFSFGSWLPLATSLIILASPGLVLGVLFAAFKGVFARYSSFWWGLSGVELLMMACVSLSSNVAICLMFEKRLAQERF